MARGRKAEKRIDETPLQRASRIAREQAAAREAQAPLVNEFAAQHGVFERNLKFVVNRGGTPIARWKAAGSLDDHEVAAIEHCWQLWGRAGRQSGLVMDLSKIPGMPGGDGLAQQEAINDLHRIKNYFPAKWWNIFENVCRFDEPAGVAGSKLANNKDEHVAAARTAVKFVASMIAWKERLSY